MEYLTNAFANITHQFDQMVAMGQSLIEGMTAAVSMLSQLASLASQVIDFLASIQVSPPM